jgi:hypothetical protein
MADEDLHDAVAAHEAVSAHAPIPALVSAAAAPAAPSAPDSWPLAGACAAAIGFGAYTFRRSRRAQ